MTTSGSVLWGRDHTDLDRVAVQTPRPGVALALTRGRFPKGYAHVEPNEDVVAAIDVDGGIALMVADAHNGCLASEVAIGVALDRMRPLTADQAPARREWAAVLHAVSDAVATASRDVEGPAQASRTTLAVALVGHRSVHWAAVGDSAVFTVAAGRAKQLNRARPRFLGHPEQVAAVERDLEHGTVPLRRVGWVVLATDGLTEFVRPADRAVAAAAAGTDDPADLVRLLVDAAGRGGAGDNVAVAAARVPVSR